MTAAGGLARCQEELAAARLLADKGFSAQAVSRAYFAAFFAAETALLALGETRSKHSGVVAAFIHLLVRGGDLDQDTGRLLRSLFERRNEADMPLSRSRPRRPMRPSEMLSTWSLPSSDGSTNAIDERDCGPSCLTLLVIVLVLVRRSEADCWSFDLERAVRVLDGWGYHSVVFKPARANRASKGAW